MWTTPNSNQNQSYFDFKRCNRYSRERYKRAYPNKSINNLMSKDFEIMLYPTKCDDSENFNLQDEHLAQSEAGLYRI